jgi:hypothetical protein
MAGINHKRSQHTGIDIFGKKSQHGHTRRHSGDMHLSLSDLPDLASSDEKNTQG